MTRPRRIGLTGGLASGKSFVADILRGLGAAVVDADRMAREVVAPGGPAHGDVVREFGREVLSADGTIDRKRLGSRIFGDPDARRRLNALTHPHIRRRMGEEAERLSAEAEAPTIVFDIPLLFDTTDGRDLALDGVVVVFAPEGARVCRAMIRDALTRDEARRRLEAQVPLSDKVARADWVIDNGGTREATREQVERLWREWHGRGA